MSGITQSGSTTRRGKPRILGPIFVLATLGLGLFAVVTQQIDVDPVTLKFNTDPWTKKACSRIERAGAASVDGTRKASILDFTCHGHGRTGTWTAVSLVNSGEEPTASDAVFVGDRRYDEAQINLKWIDSATLRITLPGDAVVIDHKLIHWGVTTEIGYQPNHPGMH